MKRKASTQAISTRRKVPRTSQSTVSAQVKKELRKQTDWKYCDQTLTAVGVSSTGAVYGLLNTLVRGHAGLNNFDGNIIRPQAITFKYYWNTDQAFNTVRVLIVQWNDVTIPTPGSILQAIGTGLGTISPVNINNKSFMKVLYDKTHILAPTAGDASTAYGEGVVYDQVYIPGKRMKPIRYNATSNTVVTGNLYLLQISDDSIATFPTIHWYSRVTFSDN